MAYVDGGYTLHHNLAEPGNERVHVNLLREVQTQLNHGEGRKTSTRQSSYRPIIVDGADPVSCAVISLLHAAIGVFLHGLEEVSLGHGRG